MNKKKLFIKNEASKWLGSIILKDYKYVKKKQSEKKKFNPSHGQFF